MRQILTRVVMALALSCSPVLAASAQPPPADDIASSIGAGDVAATRRAIDTGLKVNGRELHGWTPLQHAAFYGQVPVARYLLSRGADVNARDDEGHTPLHCTLLRTNHVSYYSGEMLRLLLAHGADVNARTRSGSTPLLMVAGGGLADGHAERPPYPEMRAVDVVRLLLDAGADVNAKDQAGRTALALASGKHKVTGQIQLDESEQREVDRSMFDPVAHLLRERQAEPKLRNGVLVARAGAYDPMTLEHLRVLLKSRSLPCRLLLQRTALQVWVARGREVEARELVRDDAAKRGYNVTIVGGKGTRAASALPRPTAKQAPWKDLRPERELTKLLREAEFSEQTELGKVLRVWRLAGMTRYFPYVESMQLRRRSLLAWGEPSKTIEASGCEVIITLARKLEPNAARARIRVQVWDGGKRVELLRTDIDPVEGTLP